VGSSKRVPLRSTGMPVACTAHTVKSAVKRISGSTKTSPKGTANSRNSSGKVSEPARRRPSTASAIEREHGDESVLHHHLHAAHARGSQAAPASASSTSAGQ
jgi:hypothetical protein